MTERICGNCKHYRADYKSSSVGCCMRYRMEDAFAYHGTTYSSTPECNAFCNGWVKGYERLRKGGRK